MRLGKKDSPDVSQVTVYVSSTDIGGKVLSIRELVTFEVEISPVKNFSLLKKLGNLAQGDEVTVEFIRNGDKWDVTDIISKPNLGRSVEDWFKDLKEDMEFWNNKNK